MLERKGVARLFFLGEVCGGGAGHVLGGHFTLPLRALGTRGAPFTVCAVQGSAQPCTPLLSLLVSLSRCLPQTVRWCSWTEVALFVLACVCIA